MSSRGKQLVQLALEKIREREMPVTVDRNNNIEEDFSDEEFESGVLPTVIQYKILIKLTNREQMSHLNKNGLQS